MKIKRPTDKVLTAIADYVTQYEVTSKAAYETARYSLLDSVACALEAQHHVECTRLLGPIVPGASLAHGARVPGTNFRLEPVKAAFDISTAIRWVEYNDTWFGKDGGHPSDNLGAVFAAADYLNRSRARGGRRLSVMDVLTALIKVYEIQGVLMLENDFISLGLDSVGTVSIASSAVVTHMLGGGHPQIINAMSNAWLDGISPRLYRIGHSAGPRKAWAAGNAASRGMLHSLMALRGESGYPSVLTTPKWGIADALLRGKAVVLGRPLGTHIVENVLYKIPFPAHFHSQTATECALKLHSLVKARISGIKTVRMETHAKTMEAIYKTGPLTNAASRDHCLQYIVAMVLLHGKLDDEDYSDKVAADPRIDALRAKMVVTENKAFTRDFYDARKRTNTNSMQIEWDPLESTCRHASLSIL